MQVGACQLSVATVAAARAAAPNSSNTQQCKYCYMPCSQTEAQTKEKKNKKRGHCQVKRHRAADGRERLAEMQCKEHPKRSSRKKVHVLNMICPQAASYYCYFYDYFHISMSGLETDQRCGTPASRVFFVLCSLKHTSRHRWHSSAANLLLTDHDHRARK